MKTTVAALAELLRQWPLKGATGEPTTVLIGGPYPDILTPPQQIVAAGPIESDRGGFQNLVLYPPQLELPRGYCGPNATALDLAMAYIHYRQTTPLDVYDGNHEAALALRAVEAIRRLQALPL